MNWIILSFVAMVTFALNAVLIVDLLKKGITIQFILLLTYLMALPVLSILVYKKGASTILITPRIIFVIIIAAALSLIGNLAQFEAGAKAPNAGMAFAIVACQVVIITILSRFLLGGSSAAWQLIGIGFCLVGVLIINLAG